jgi:hypothetical protein
MRPRQPVPRGEGQRFRLVVLQLVVQLHGLLEGRNRARKVLLDAQDLALEDARQHTQQALRRMLPEFLRGGTGGLLHAREIELREVHVAQPQARVAL